MKDSPSVGAHRRAVFPDSTLSLFWASSSAGLTVVAFTPDDLAAQTSLCSPRLRPSSHPRGQDGRRRPSAPEQLEGRPEPPFPL